MGKKIPEIKTIPASREQYFMVNSNIFTLEISALTLIMIIPYYSEGIFSESNSD